MPDPTYKTAHHHSGTRSFGYDSIADGTITYTFDPARVFSAGVRYVLDVYNKIGEDTVSFEMRFGVAGGDDAYSDHTGLGTDTGNDGQPWNHHRICWTPAADRTGVRVVQHLVQSAAGFYVTDDLTLYTSSMDQLAGTNPKAARCDHGHYAHEIVLTGAAAGLSATNVQGAFEEHIPDADAHHAQDHATRHADGGADELEIADLATAETDTALVLHPDGSGGVGWGTDATSGGGGAIAHAYRGYNTIGATAEQATAFRWYLKKITIQDGETILSVDAYIQGRANGATPSVGVAVLEDNAGSPRYLRAANVPVGPLNPDAANDASAGTARWVRVPVTYHNDSGASQDVWIGFAISANTWNVHKDGTGADRYFTPGSLFAGDAGFFTVTTTTDRYSLRAKTIK